MTATNTKSTRSESKVQEESGNWVTDGANLLLIILKRLFLLMNPKPFESYPKTHPTQSTTTSP